MKLLLTLDYEMYNGLIGGTISNCLIRPMEQLEVILDEYNYKATLFVDACFLLTLKRIKSTHKKLEDDWVAINRQLKRLSEKGHSIQLHLHPQWLNARYENGIWYSDLSKYKLADLSEQEVRKLFSEGCRLIEDITGVAPSAFRAGDYCVQTYHNITEVFKENGIVIDSSVLRHKKVINKREWFDYTHIPSRYSYRFQKDVVTEQATGMFTEVSIPTFKHHVCDIYRRRKEINKKSNTPWGDGTSSTGGQLDNCIVKIYRLIKLFVSPMRMSASIDGISATYLKEIYETERKNGVEYMLIMGHPKTFTPYYLSLFEDFISTLQPDDISVTIEKMNLV